MKKSLCTALLLGCSITLAAPAFADHRDHQDRFEGSSHSKYEDRHDKYAYTGKYESRHGKSAHASKYDRHSKNHDRQAKKHDRHDKYDRHAKKHYKHYRKHGKHYRTHAYANNHRQPHRYAHDYRQRRHYDNDWYKWLAGSYIAGELIHHYHNGRVCYSRH